MDDELSKKEHKEQRKMAKRRDRSKYKKTDRDKWEKKQSTEAEQKFDREELLKGRVLAIFPEEVHVEHENQIFPCVLRGVLKKK